MTCEEEVAGGPGSRELQTAPSGPSTTWPLPLTPAYGSDAHEVEAARAVAAKARRCNQVPPAVLAQDETGSVVVVAKSAGAYCEDAAAGFSHVRGGSFVALGHRLDRDTSGALALATSQAALGALHKAFSHPGGLVRKAYVALAHASCVPQPTVVRSGHGRSAHGLWRAYPVADCGRQLPGGGGTVKLAETALQWFGPPDEQQRCLLLAVPRQGRTHQVRLHAALAGTPLSGDVRYGGLQNTQDAVLLHAALLGLPPLADVAAAVTCVAPLPDWVAQCPPDARHALEAALQARRDGLVSM